MKRKYQEIDAGEEEGGAEHCVPAHYSLKLHRSHSWHSWLPATIQSKPMDSYLSPAPLKFTFWNLPSPLCLGAEMTAPPH